jgi:hypothetical protein
MTNSIVQPSQETFNSILLDILKGTRDAGHDIYAASKETIVKAVDFAQEQAPLVVQEFIKWKFCEALLQCVCSVFIMFVILYFLHKLNKHRIRGVLKNDPDQSFGSAVVMVIISFFMCILVIPSAYCSLESIIKIKVAPRIYLIDFVTNEIQKCRN